MTGIVEAPVSDIRWCSDTFEIRCDSNERVRVAFSLDCCDHDVLGFVASTGSIAGEMIRDLIVQSAECRFDPILMIPKPPEWLTYNGSCYTVADTRKFGEQLGFDVCTTPVSSPESNGMVEAFVKTFKRGYVAIKPTKRLRTA